MYFYTLSNSVNSQGYKDALVDCQHNFVINVSHINKALSNYD